jgi:uncharacterized glyoxalase superfamily protein PhnB
VPTFSALCLLHHRPVTCHAFVFFAAGGREGIETTACLISGQALCGGRSKQLLSVPSEAEADQIFKRWQPTARYRCRSQRRSSRRFGAVADKFGVSWMIGVRCDCVERKKADPWDVEFCDLPLSG